MPAAQRRQGRCSGWSPEPRLSPEDVHGCGFLVCSRHGAQRLSAFLALPFLWESRLWRFLKLFQPGGAHLCIGAQRLHTELAQVLGEGAVSWPPQGGTAGMGDSRPLLQVGSPPPVVSLPVTHLLPAQSLHRRWINCKARSLPLTKSDHHLCSEPWSSPAGPLALEPVGLMPSDTPQPCIS